MNFPPYWAKAQSKPMEIGGRTMRLTCWRWSLRSLDEAGRLAGEAVQALATRCAQAGEIPQHYGYLDRPMREPVLQEIRNDGDTVAAVVTRNSYGCQVLNTARVLFLDVDLENAKPTGLLARLFGFGVKKQSDTSTLLAKAGKWVRQHPEWGLRVYRTKAGLRLMATHDQFNPEETGRDEAMTKEWGVDPLYQRLCVNQKCYRARLTPKPWRCGISRPPARWPFADATTEARFKEWLRGYEEASKFHSVCRLLETFGNTRVHPEVEPVLRFHDAATGELKNLPLA